MENTIQKKRYGRREGHDFFHITQRLEIKPKEKIVSAEQSQQSLVGPEKKRDFAKPLEEIRGSENLFTQSVGLG